MPPVRYHTGGFPPEKLDWPKLIPFIGPASASLARYDGTLAAIPNPRVLLAPLTTREAVLSSRIEGTQTTMGEVLEFEAGREPASAARREDIHEVLNYRAAMRRAEDMMRDLPLCQRVVREAHGVLLAHVRGQDKAPGQYRRTAVWIGPPGSTVDEAKFVPVDAQRLPDAMSAWEKYIHADAPDRLVQLAILHAEFEALHPFLDGNGRMGRLFVPLFLWRHGQIRAPTFYISAWFEAHRDAYYEGLLSVSRDNDWTGWCRFFLQAVQAQAEDNLARAEGILDLYEDLKQRVAALTRSRYAIPALDWIFERPIFGSADFAAGTGAAPRTARRILDVLCENGILRVVLPGAGRRTAVLAFPDLLNIAEGEKTV